MAGLCFSEGRFMMVPNNGDETISESDVTGVVTTLQGGEEGAVSVYDMATFKRVNRLKLVANLSLETGATTADGRKIYGASSTDDLVYVIDSTESGQVYRQHRTFPMGGDHLGAASPKYCY